MNTTQIMRQVKDTARNGYAWPGGYPLMLLMDDGAVLCHVCAKSEFKQIARSTIQNNRDGWRCEAVTTHMEGPPEQCAHCNATIESAYGDPDMTVLIGPAHWASYLINGDASGLDDGEEDKITAWLKRNGVRNDCLTCSEEPSFTWQMQLHCPEVDYQGGDVLDYTFPNK